MAFDEVIPQPAHLSSVRFWQGAGVAVKAEGTDLGKLRSDADAAIAERESRRIPGFDYSSDGPVRATYQVIGPRTTRPDGRKPFIPAYGDHRTPRPNRHIMLDFVEPIGGVSDSIFEVALSKRAIEVLALPGWMAARHSSSSAAAPPRLAFSKYLVIWETEGGHAQELQDRFTAATKAGELKALAVDPTTAQPSWWVTTSPFNTKDDFQR